MFGLLQKRRVALDKTELNKARRYIAKYWKELTRYTPKNVDTLVGLPNRYIVPAPQPNNDFDFDEMYYWDNYFIAQGLHVDDRQELLEGILENMCALLTRFGMVPNASRDYLTSRSQPPLLTSFIFDLYDTYQYDNAWLKRYIEVARQEYSTVWMGTKKPHWRLAHKGLSRFFDINLLNDLAEAESGWDMTPRFAGKCLDYLPVDLNAYLYKYEMDFARACEILGETKVAQDWLIAAEARKKTMNELMWSKTWGLYYDYNYAKKRRGSVVSLATYIPMWAGMVSDTQAEKLVRNLRRFEQKGGLATTEQQLPRIATLPRPEQWAYPNGWAPLHFFVVEGLRRYGYEQDARRIARKWLNTNLHWFSEHGVFLEKYNVASPNKPPTMGHYPTQTGFAWTNAVFEYFCDRYAD